MEVRSDWEAVFSESVQRFLRPVARLLLRFGMGASEFCSIAKAVFVQVASEEYGIRGRPTSVSRVAAMTGLSRKEVARLRSVRGVVEWTPQQAATPLNEVLHYWHTDPDFVDEEGEPLPLTMTGRRGFEFLVAKYAGDIPAGAVKRELEQRGAITRTNDVIAVKKRFVHRAALNEDFVRNLAFSLEALCTTLAHNAEVVEKSQGPYAEHPELHLERIAWSKHMTQEGINEFREWVRREGMRFLEEADGQIGARELSQESWGQADPRTVGVGVFFFERN